ncbi:DUF4232 domain-containing protein [Streptomyces sp. NPDC003077]|uniref:DUF4232 domain-containing protein n=1 Tax=Streptomyces sp. NPDC003077 TaxID=3154443 RepID=UPI0033A45476
MPRNAATADTTTAATAAPRGPRARTLRIAAAGLTAVAALSLTACSGQDTTKPAASGTPASTTQEATPTPPAPAAQGTGGAQADGRQQTGGQHKGGGAGSQASGGNHAEQASTGHGTTAKPGTPAAGGKGSGTATTQRATCDPSKVTIVAKTVSRPINHLLIQATNTSGKSCDLYGSPFLKFEDAQAPIARLEGSKPQAVVTLAPGQSGYAGLMTSSGDGSGTNGRDMKSLTVYLSNREGNGSAPGQANVALPGGSVYIDSSAWVTYWQQNVGDALN